MGQSAGFRTQLRSGDRVCFYAARIGVVARATMAGDATKLLPDDEVPGGPPEKPIYRVPLRDIVWLPAPIPLDPPATRASLDGFRGKPIKNAWGWFVQGTNKLTAHDFRVLTGQLETNQASDIG